jgi:hypothetical protein
VIYANDPILGSRTFERDDWPAVLAFVKSEALHPTEFAIREDGVVRFKPELARTVLQLAV